MVWIGFIQYQVSQPQIQNSVEIYHWKCVL